MIEIVRIMDLRSEGDIPSLYTLSLDIFLLMSSTDSRIGTNTRHDDLGSDKLEQRPTVPPDPLDLVHNLEQWFPDGIRADVSVAEEVDLVWRQGESGEEELRDLLSDLSHLSVRR